MSIYIYIYIYMHIYYIYIYILRLTFTRRRSHSVAFTCFLIIMDYWITFMKFISVGISIICYYIYQIYNIIIYMIYIYIYIIYQKYVSEIYIIYIVYRDIIYVQIYKNIYVYTYWCYCQKKKTGVRAIKMTVFTDQFRLLPFKEKYLISILKKGNI